jgi:hypothetical protein
LRLICSHNPLFSTDNILTETQQEFHLSSIKGMRRIASRAAYIELLDCLAKSVTGRKRYMENRMTKPLSEWFTLTDEAFLLLCLENNVAKWNKQWARKQLLLQVPPQAQQQQQGQEIEEEIQEEALYTGKSRGTKRSWSAEGLERFNALMIDVYRDRKENGTNFDIVFQQEMNLRYTPRQEEEEPDPGGQEHEQMPHVNRVVQVYSDFNMEDLVAHAADASGTGAGGVASVHDADEETSSVPV